MRTVVRASGGMQSLSQAASGNKLPGCISYKLRIITYKASLICAAQQHLQAVCKDSLVACAVSSQSVGRQDVVEVLSSDEEDAASMDHDVREQVRLVLFE